MAPSPVQAANRFHTGSHSFIQSGSRNRGRMRALAGPALVMGVGARRGTKLNRVPDLPGPTVRAEETDAN